MLQRQHLREGNWMICHDPKRRMGDKEYFCQVSWRHLRELQLDEVEGAYQPIELTPDILQKCNWTPDAESTVFYHPKFGNYLVLKKGVRGYDTVVLHNSTYVGEPMQYLHQLQNRYSSLVFEELEVSL